MWPRCCFCCCSFWNLCCLRVWLGSSPPLVEEGIPVSGFAFVHDLIRAWPWFCYVYSAWSKIFPVQYKTRLKPSFLLKPLISIQHNNIQKQQHFQQSRDNDHYRTLHTITFFSHISSSLHLTVFSSWTGAFCVSTTFYKSHHAFSRKSFEALPSLDISVFQFYHHWREALPSQDISAFQLHHDWCALFHRTLLTSHTCTKSSSTSSSNDILAFLFQITALWILLHLSTLHFTATPFPHLRELSLPISFFYYCDLSFSALLQFSSLPSSVLKISQPFYFTFITVLSVTLYFSISLYMFIKNPFSYSHFTVFSSIYCVFHISLVSSKGIKVFIKHNIADKLY